MAGKPPFEWEDEEEDFYQIEGRKEHVFVRSADELEGLLGVESHVFVCCIVGDVLVGRVVQGHQDVKQDNHDDEGVNVVEDKPEGMLSDVSAGFEKNLYL